MLKFLRYTDYFVALANHHIFKTDFEKHVIQKWKRNKGGNRGEKRKKVKEAERESGDGVRRTE